MKILSLYIDNFGKLSNYRLELGSDLNCIFKENGYGKTTLAVFIKSMLYGMQKSTKRSPLENDRKHYLPWSGGAYGGTLDIETDTGRYRIERSFGKKESDDTFTLRDLATGLESKAYTEDIGVELFGIDSSSFEKSVFSLQGKAPEISMTSDIGAKLSNMLESSADMAESDRALELLDKYMKRFRLKKGSGGVIDELKDELADVLAENDACRRASESAAEQKRYLDELNERSGGVKAKEKELLERLEGEREGALRDVEYRRYLEYIEDAERHKKKSEELRAFFPEKLPDKEELERIRTFCRGIELKEKSADFELSPPDSVKYENYRERFGDVPPSDDELASLSERLSALKASESEAFSFKMSDPPERDEPLSRAAQKMFFAAFAVCLAAAAGLGVLCLKSFNYLFAGGAIAAATLGLAFLVAFFVKRALVKRAELANEEKYRLSLEEYEHLNESQEEKRIENERERLDIEELLGKYYPACPGGADATLARLYTDVESYRALISSLEQLDAKNAEKRKRIAELHEMARKMLREYGVDVTYNDYDGAIQYIFEKMQELARSASDYTETRRRAAQYAKEKDIDPSSPPVSNDTRKTEAELSSLRESLNALSSEIGATENRIASLEQVAEKQYELMHRADALRAEIAQAEGKWASAQKAKELLERARDTLSSKYLGTMEGTFEKNCERFGSLLPSPQIDAKLGLTFRDGGSDRDSEWYSAGMRCVINLCMRLALANALFENEKPFMVLDDPFTDLDEKHLDAAKKIIKELASEQQIIYLTCSAERVIE